MIPRIKIGAALGVNGMTLGRAMRKRGMRVGRRGVAGSQGDIGACADEWRKYVGLALELKIYPRKPSEAQLDVHEILRNAGWKVVICYGIGDVECAIKNYLQPCHENHRAEGPHQRTP